jgi:hypothetical protein
MLLRSVVPTATVRDSNLESCEECRKSEPLNGDSVLTPHWRCKLLVASMFATDAIQCIVGRSVSVPSPHEGPFLPHRASSSRKCLDQRYSTGGTRGHLMGYVKYLCSFINFYLAGNNIFYLIA